jgi:hypothetical protein
MQNGSGYGLNPILRFVGGKNSSIGKRYALRSRLFSEEEDEWIR